jgi:hypothetical protein
MSEEKETWDYGYIEIPFEQLHSLLQLPLDWKVVTLRRRRKLDKSFLHIGVQHPSLPDPLQGRDPKDVPDWELRAMQEPEVGITYTTETRNGRAWKSLESIGIKEEDKETTEQLWKRRHDIRQILDQALSVKEAKHKQWYLHRLADELDIPGHALMRDQGEDPEDEEK